MFRSWLQELCQREQWALPEYATTRDGPDHDPRFQSTVSLRGFSFHGPSGLRSAKEAQSEAACLAFRHFSQQASPLTPPNVSSYKQKLQEVCQKKRLSLPKYDIAKDGPDHMPRFRATVYAGGLTFEGPAQCLSIKDAQGQAAMIAFDHFSGTAESLPSVESGSPQAGAKKMANDGIPTRNEVSTVAVDNARDPDRQSVKQVCILDSEIPFKSQLQNYAQRRKLKLPSYYRVCEGSIHSFHYKARVTIDSQTFESQQFFSSLKEAENAAAKVALASLLTEADYEDDPVFFKNLLLELIQKEDLPAAVFETVSEGSSHSPLFVSTVEIGCKKFKGVTAKTKRQAEQHAAKVAWMILKECKDSRHGGGLTFNFKEHENFEVSHQQTNQVADTKKLEVSTIRGDVQRCTSADLPISVDKFPNVNVTSQAPEVANPLPHYLDTDHLTTGLANMVIENNSKNRTMAKEGSALSISEQPKSPGKPSSTSSIGNGCSDIPVGSDSLRSCNKIQVYPRRSDLQLPKGARVLPLYDEKWVAVQVDPTCS